MKKLWNKAKFASDTITGYISIVGFSFIYMTVFPLFVLMVKREKPDKKTNWKPWNYKADTLEECRKQY
jgi:hypothetical protein